MKTPSYPSKDQFITQAKSLWENRVQEPSLESFSSWNGKQGRLWWPIPLAAVTRSYSQERKRWPPFVKAASETQETGAERDREEILSQRHSDYFLQTQRGDHMISVSPEELTGSKSVSPALRESKDGVPAPGDLPTQLLFLVHKVRSGPGCRGCRPRGGTGRAGVGHTSVAGRQAAGKLRAVWRSAGM